MGSTALRLVVGVTGASGVIYGVRFLEVCKHLGVETYLIMTPAGQETLRLETSYLLRSVQALAHTTYRIQDIAAAVASGSFATDGMVIIPCSMKTLAGVAHGYADNLLLRAAEVTLKERRPLVLVPREAPLTRVHLQNLLAAHDAGAIVVPASPGFYHHPRQIEELVDHVVGKVLSVLRIPHQLYPPWEGPVSRAERDAIPR